MLVLTFLVFSATICEITKCERYVMSNYDLFATYRPLGGNEWKIRQKQRAILEENRILSNLSLLVAGLNANDSVLLVKARCYDEITDQIGIPRHLQIWGNRPRCNNVQCFFEEISIQLGRNDITAAKITMSVDTATARITTAVQLDRKATLLFGPEQNATRSRVVLRRRRSVNTLVTVNTPLESELLNATRVEVQFSRTRPILDRFGIPLPGVTKKVKTRPRKQITLGFAFDSRWPNTPLWYLGLRGDTPEVLQLHRPYLGSGVFGSLVSTSGTQWVTSTGTNVRYCQDRNLRFFESYLREAIDVPQMKCCYDRSLSVIYDEC